MPAADDLFRPTAPQETEPHPTERSSPPTPKPPRPSGSAQSSAPSGSSQAERADRVEQDSDRKGQEQPPPDSGGGRGRKPSGRVRHDEKMTVYVTSEELLDLEHARLTLRRSTGLAVDRGRVVREAVAIVLADLEANGEESMLVRRLKQR